MPNTKGSKLSELIDNPSPRRIDQNTKRGQKDLKSRSIPCSPDDSYSDFSRVARTLAELRTGTVPISGFDLGRRQTETDWEMDCGLRRDRTGA
jgi:hypothetical protein